MLQANYNLVIPTITALCNHIEVSDSAVGLVIGCCDIATIFGTLGYSIWTNTNYKVPLFSCCSDFSCLP